ncbi:MAG TPA: hypothetical protein VLS51_09245, partial [Propionibacteriaceae bacterium]|nr:hypothetical protein [Propionibacteriaceae bacterium]
RQAPPMSSLERLLSLGFVAACFVLYTTWVLVVPFDAAPDEAMRYRLIRYISEKLAIPSGLDPATRDPIWGTSYAFEPILAALVAAFLRSVAGVFTSDAHALALASRFASVIFGTGTVALCVLISRRVFTSPWRWLFVALVALLPQFAFLSCYLNSDSLAIFSTALILYAWVRGLRDGWSTGTAALLGLGISVCLLSYFTAYGFILLSVVVYLADRFRGWRRAPLDDRRAQLRETLVQVAVIAGVVLVLAAWWFVRNAYLYHGDFLGLRTSGEQGALYAENYAKPGASSALGRGWTLWQMLFRRGWIAISGMSSVGVFGYMKVRMPSPVYGVYAIITVAGFVALLPSLWRWISGVRGQARTTAAPAEERVSLPGFSVWARGLLHAALLVAIPIPIALSIYHSYTQDYQPQGRYILPMLLPVAYFVTKGFADLMTRYVSSPRARLAVFAILCAWTVFATLLALVGVVIPHYHLHT